MEQYFGHKIFCVVIQPTEGEYNYPFLDTKIQLGILQDEDLEDINYEYIMH